MISRLQSYADLIRLNKPIGWLLLLWPTMMALWIASHGHPSPTIFIIFLCGVFLTRSAGDAINDFADRHFDGKVQRTQQRPLAKKSIHAFEAVAVSMALFFIAFLLVLQLNLYTIILSFIALLIACCYPFMKRITHLPQLVLGIAYGFGIPMAFAAENNHIPFIAWLILLTSILCTLSYDSMYAMTDREDDLLLGLKSTALLFGRHDKLIIFILQVLSLALFVMIGIILQMHIWYYAGLIACGVLFLYQQYLIKDRVPQKCFQAFLNNNWALCFVFLGVFINYL